MGVQATAEGASEHNKIAIAGDRAPVSPISSCTTPLEKPTATVMRGQAASLTATAVTEAPAVTGGSWLRMTAAAAALRPADTSRTVATGVAVASCDASAAAGPPVRSLLRVSLAT